MRLHWLHILFIMCIQYSTGKGWEQDKKEIFIKLNLEKYFFQWYAYDR
ncbi:hypothetical protein ANACOL_02002 [Anaerotruncus colihominis DSM 17241]|uniref:Uncharacterized protein n=1 Tax=Anaerotruncus colihominis DSM 17241 TaxID=445972 RepID=B0PB50_9FIRM|nr:hypothetical protein ANACOL_02002 [Anaerotruncus colihominis DSM 17241]